MVRSFSFFMFDDINKAILIGRLGADPELRYISDGVPVISFSVATSISRKDLKTGYFSKKTEWYKAVLYGNFAESAKDYLKKGHKVYIEGSFKTVKTKTKEYVEINVSTLRLLMFEAKVEKDDNNIYQNDVNNKDNIPF